MTEYLDLNNLLSSEEDDENYEDEEPGTSTSDEDDERVIPILRSRGATETETTAVSAANVIKPQTSRKRHCNINSWHRNVTKKKVNSKIKHITSTFKLTVDSSVCGQCSCSFECSRRITENEQKIIHDSFANLGDRNKQILWVCQNTEVIEPKYRYAVGDSRQCNRKYFVPVEGIQVRVCKIFFMNTLNVSDTFLRNAFKNFNENTGQIKEDGRGKHCNRKRISEEDKGEVRNHINSFKRIESHYLQAQTTREYLEGNLNLSVMYQLYASEMISRGKKAVKQHLYTQIFNNEFNLGFFKPKKDQCDLCTVWHHMDESERELSTNEQLKNKYENHITNKNLSRKEREDDIKFGKIPENETVVCCYDLQAIMQSPCGEISSFFYKSKLNCYNFTIFNCVQNVGHCYFWNESVAFKGANEISTFVYFFLKYHIGKKNFIFFSDNCSSQNKNKALISMYFWAVQRLGIEKITHKYLIKGHTQNQADSMHSCIERNKKQFLRCNNIYTPSDWVAIIKTAKRKGPPFLVYEALGNEFMDFKNFAKYFDFKDLHSFMNIKVLEIRKNDNYLYFKTDYNEESFQKILLTKRYVKYSEINPGLARAKTSISNSKKKDLMEMCASGVIPKQYHDFYKNLTTCLVSEIEDTDEVMVFDIELDEEF